jgi:hypothetical protein
VGSTPYVKQIISVDWIFSVMSVVVPCVVRILRPWIESIILNISPAPFARRSLGHKTHTMNMKAGSIAISITRRSSHSGVTVATLQF